MFDNIWANLKTIIAAFDNPSVDTIGEALKAAGSLLKEGWDLFKDLFGNKLVGFSGADPLEACRALVADHDTPGLKAAALDGGALLKILALIKKLLELFGS